MAVLPILLHLLRANPSLRLPAPLEATEEGSREIRHAISPTVIATMLAAPASIDRRI